MISRINRKSFLPVFVMLSLAGHLIGGYLTGFLGPFDLRPAVSLVPAISVTLETPANQLAPPAVMGKHVPPEGGQNPAIPSDGVAKKNIGDASDRWSIRESRDRYAVGRAAYEQPPQNQKMRTEGVETGEIPAPLSVHKNKDNTEISFIPVPPLKELEHGPVRSAGEFVPFAREKLTYRITLFGIPAGTTVMEATNSNGEVRITTRVISNDVVSSIYPVDISTETRLVSGNYLLTRIRRHEGSATSDTGFTLMLRERNAFWVDRLGNRYANSPLPREDVMDMISGFYYLRNQRLEVGRPVLLHLFDSCEYAPTTVEVLRKEHLRLPGFREADTLVVQPILKTDGFFRRSGEVVVWLTDDEKKVPVKMEAQIPLGKVAAELVSAETEKTLEAVASGVVLNK